MAQHPWPDRDEKEAIFALTAELAALDGPAGFEGPVVRRLVELLRPLADEITVDRFGNIIATRHGRDGAGHGPSLMISAHSDEIGGVVRAFEPDGMVRFERLGGVVETTLIGRRVRINGLRGVVGVRAGHVQSADERLKSPPLRDLYIDLGTDSAAATRALGIAVGDPIAYESETVRLANPDRISGKAIDNRIACALLVRLFARLQGVALRVCESIGARHGILRGAAVRSGARGWSGSPARCAERSDRWLRARRSPARTRLPCGCADRIATR